MNTNPSFPQALSQPHPHAASVLGEWEPGSLHLAGFQETSTCRAGVLGAMQDPPPRPTMAHPESTTVDLPRGHLQAYPGLQFLE